LVMLLMTLSILLSLRSETQRGLAGHSFKKAVKLRDIVESALQGNRRDFIVSTLNPFCGLLDPDPVSKLDRRGIHVFGKKMRKPGFTQVYL
jgi:hypothetical protein